MRRITVSVLSVFIALPAFSARLPVVNVGAAGVSARDAFGEGTQKIATVTSRVDAIDVNAQAALPAVSVAPAPKKNVVARSAARGRVTKSASGVDAGEKIVASADVLVPHRPSADLWARVDTPLRMPTESEFSVVRADYNLPEESLDIAPRQNLVARNDVAPAPIARSGALDAEIDRLVDWQRRADESMAAASVKKSNRVIAAPIANDVPVARTVTPRNAVKENQKDIREIANDTPSLRRMVVPMTQSDDVIVRTVEKNTSPRIASARNDMTSMSPSELRKAFRKTYLSENKHLSTYQIDDRFDVASDMTASIEGFTAKRDLSEGSGVRPLEIKIKFRGDDSALSRDNYNLLTEYAGIVVNNPKRAIQVAIPGRATTNMDDRKLAARRLAIVEQVLRDTGVSEQRIMPVLSQRDDESFVLRIISSDQYETLSQKKRDMFGDTISKKTYKSMSW